MSITLNGETRLFPIIGQPIVYARSPELLSARFQARQINAICPPLEVPVGALLQTLDGLSLCPNVDGLLVTMPHKRSCLTLCQSLSVDSKVLGAVSCMRHTPEGAWHGDTLDGESFVDAQVLAGAKVTGGRALLIGAGGAGSAIGLALVKRGVAELAISDIDESRAEALVVLLRENFGGNIHLAAPDPTGFDLLAHATNMGMQTTDPLPVDVGLLSPGLHVGDVIAGHGETALIAAAKAAGCSVANGDQMVEAVLDMMIDFLTGLR